MQTTAPMISDREDSTVWIRLARGTISSAATSAASATRKTPRIAAPGRRCPSIRCPDPGATVAAAAASSARRSALEVVSGVSINGCRSESAVEVESAATATARSAAVGQRSPLDMGRAVGGGRRGTGDGRAGFVDSGLRGTGEGRCGGAAGCRGTGGTGAVQVSGSSPATTGRPAGAGRIRCVRSTRRGHGRGGPVGRPPPGGEPSVTVPLSRPE